MNCGSQQTLAVGDLIRVADGYRDTRGRTRERLRDDLLAIGGEIGRQPGIGMDASLLTLLNERLF